MHRFRNHIAFLLIAAFVTAVTVSYFLLVVNDPAQRHAAERAGQSVVAMPADFQLSLQTPLSPFHHEVRFLNHFLLALNLFVCGLVGVLAIYIVWRYRRSRNQIPSSRTHNPLLEVMWTIIPAILLMIMAIPSMRLLRAYDVIPPAELTLKVTGHQWYWEYHYPDYGDLSIQSVIVPEDQLAPQDKGKRLLVPDQYVVLPVDTTIRIQITGADVIHSFFVPSLGLQRYAIPGRLNETWTRIEREGVYYGQCNQICGTNHAFMPIAIRAVSRPEFEAWVKGQRIAAAPQAETGIPEATSPPASKTPPAPPANKTPPAPSASKTPPAPPASKASPAPPPAPAASQLTVTGNDALALAALVAQYSPREPKATKRALSNLLDGKLNVKYPESKKITVAADSIDCRASIAGSAAYTCDLKFATKSVSINGRKAHELLATLVEAGTASRQEAGALPHAMGRLSCEITPSEIRRKSGKGSECQFEPGPR